MEGSTPVKAFLKILSAFSIILMLSCQSGAAPLPGDDRPRQFHHTVLEEPKVIKKIPIVQAGEYGRYVGRLDLYFTLENGRYVLKRFKGVLIPITEDLPADPAIKALIDGYLHQSEKDAA